MAPRVDFVALYVPGPRFPSGYAGHLCRQVRAHYHGPVRFTFLAPEGFHEDADDPDVRFVPLTEHGRRWRVGIERHQEGRVMFVNYGKLEAFRPDLELGPKAVLCDLDLFVVGPLDDLLGYEGSFAARREVEGAHRPNNWQCSWVQFRPADCHDLWERALALPGAAMAARFPPKSCGGDQSFLTHYRPDADDLGKLFPDAIQAFRKEWLRHPRKRERARVVWMHGFDHKPHKHEWRLPECVSAGA